MRRRDFLKQMSMTAAALSVSRPRVFGFAQCSVDQRAPIVFAHVAVINPADASVQQDMTVVIAGDRITQVGSARAIKLPKYAEVSDGRGKFLIPGLWDMHVHTFNHSPRSTNKWFFPLFIANGITGVRDMWTTGDDFSQIIQFRKALAECTFLGPRYGAVGWLVDGPEPIFPNSDVVSTPQEARDFVHRAKAAGVDFVKVYQKLPKEEYFAIVDEAKKVGIPFAAHMPWVISAATVSDDGARSIEHLSNVMPGCSTKEEELLQTKTWGPQQVKDMVDTYDQRRCEQLLERFARNQTWQVPTSVVFFDNPSDLDSRSQYLPASVRARPQRTVQTGLSPQQRERLSIIGMMNKAGVPMMAGTDVAKLRLYPGFSLHDELALFVQAGLTPGEALKTATYNPAKFLGMLDRLGTVEHGKVADLVLLDANPVEDIHNTQKIRAVILNGRYLDRAALDRLLADAATAATQPAAAQ